MQRRVLAIANDRGSVLVIGLLTLVLLTFLGIAATNTSTTEVLIAGNDRVHKEAFYAGEVGVTAGEMVVESLPTRSELNEDTITGHYAEDTQPDWHDLEWDNTDSVAVNVADMLPAETVKRTMAAAPRYAIEERDFIRDSLTTGIGVPTGVYQFNVTGQGTGSSRAAKVMLLTVYAKRYN